MHLRNLKIKEKNSERGKLSAFLHAPKNFVSKGLVFVINNIYSPILKKLLAWRYATIAVFISFLFIIFGLIAGQRLKFVFMPPEEKKLILTRLELQPGTSFENAEKVGSKLIQSWFRVAEKYKQPNGDDFLEDWYLVGDSGSVVAIVFLPLPNNRNNVSTKELSIAWNKELGDIPEVLASSFGGGYGSDIRINIMEKMKKISLKHQICLLIN